MDKFLLILVFAALVAAGGAFVIFPEKIQKIALEYSSEDRSERSYNPWTWWIKTRSYVITLRVLGVLCFLVSAIIIRAVLR